jgi:uncharacterized membrane protein (UPF0136 family)
MPQPILNGTHCYLSLKMGTLCFVGGAAGYARTRSIPSMVAGLALGSMFMLSGLRIKEGMSYGYEGATGECINKATDLVARKLTGTVGTGCRHIACARRSHGTVRVHVSSARLALPLPTDAVNLSLPDEPSRPVDLFPSPSLLPGRPLVDITPRPSEITASNR